MQVADLAGGVAAQGNRQFFAGNATAVVFHRDQAHAACQQAHRDAGGARIERVVHQLAHDGGRAFHHFTGGNLADQLVWQVLDLASRLYRGAGQGGRIRAFQRLFVRFCSHKGILRSWHHHSG
ncbi:hypothetical protein D3C71_1771920 [compost metagenome]